ncbi:TIGR02680 family protein [Kribbella sp. NBC_00482]|uniref:TIGR02680 family protein n=1 Tax=Kribbella sp. NBC_00482 TaxID=2975968 RepID=UPI002E19BABC
MTESAEDRRFDGAEWLSAAAGDGLPVPVLRRWQPLRVGIVNLWEYDVVEFWFADGRLVLRGGNGAGKTKVLELTTLMLLRGEISPSVLDPFGSQHRSMRFNLLPTGEADDPRELTDSGLGYAWAEFGRVDEHGEPQYFTCGLGASAKRGTGTGGVKTWQLLTRRRIGRDLELSRVGRPLEETELKKEQGIRVLSNAGQYRTLLADELFGMDAEAYHNLTELLKQLRKPKLGERLAPALLEQTLRDALPPIGGAEIDQLAEGWDRLRRLRQKVEATKEAAKNLAQFTRYSWRPWASTVTWRRADRLATATDQLSETTRLRRQAEQALERSAGEVERVTKALTAARVTKSDREVEQRELIMSPAYADAVSAAGRVESRKAEVASLRDQLRRAEDRRGQATGAVERAQAAVDDAQRGIEEVSAREAKRVGALTESARAAGLGEATEQYLPERDLASLRSAADRRVERFEHHVELLTAYQQVTEHVERIAERVSDRRQQHRKAIDAESLAQTAVEGSVEALRFRLRDWAIGLTVARLSPEQVEDWCDLVAALTGSEPAETPSAAVSGFLEQQREALRREEGAVHDRQRPMGAERLKVEAEVARLRSTADEPPTAPVLWTRRTRPAVTDSRGAPLWQCVEPRPGLGSGQLDLLEAALAASGLLDAWITPHGVLFEADGNEPIEVRLEPPAGSGAGLEAVLTPTAAGGVSEETILSVLSGIGWFERRDHAPDDGDWLTADGCWRVGVLTGRAAPAQQASYLGATAREAARMRAIQAHEKRLAEIQADLDLLDVELADIHRRIETVEAEGFRWMDTVLRPGERGVIEATATLNAKAKHRAECEEAVRVAEERQRALESRLNEAWAAFADQAAQYGFPLENLETYASALRTCRAEIDRLDSLLEVVRERRTRLRRAEDDRDEKVVAVEEAAGEAEQLSGQLRQARIKLQTAEQSVHADHRELLELADELTALLEELTQSIESLSDQVGDARVAAKEAEGILDQHENRRAEAERERDAALAGWWEIADAGLMEPLGLQVPERRVVETGRDGARAARRVLRDVTDAAAEDRTWRKCSGDLQALRPGLLPTRDIRVVDDGPLPLVLVLVDGAAGWQPPVEAADALADSVRQLEEKYDAEQRDVLARLLESNFIEHLKERLDYAKGTFTHINQQLAAHPTRQGHIVRLERTADPADPEAVAVVNALEQGYAELGTERQEQVRAFISRRIDAARADAAAEGASDWKDQLTTALDYRRWLRIELQFQAGRGDRWRKFDTARHATKSGGEKVVLLSQPLFAAAVVAYNAAGPEAPRWIWLDEAMTGVDVTVKESFMGLTVSFDLDVMLTAHDEWCTYSTVPAVAIHDLARDPHLPGVDVDTYLWCGGKLGQVAPRLRVDKEIPADPDSLFGGDDDE